MISILEERFSHKMSKSTATYANVHKLDPQKDPGLNNCMLWGACIARFGIGRVVESSFKK